MASETVLFTVLPPSWDEYIPNHEELAKNRVLFQYKNSQVFLSLVSSLSGTHQKLEDGVLSMTQTLNPDAQIGKGLDLLGEIIGAERLGRSDDNYRLIIKIKIATNSSKGRIEDIISIWKMFSGATNTEVKELGNATIEISSDAKVIFGIDDYVRKLFKSVVAGGVKIYAFYYPDEPFALFSDPDDPSSLGLGDYNDPLVGGNLSSIII